MDARLLVVYLAAAGMASVLITTAALTSYPSKRGGTIIYFTQVALFVATWVALYLVAQAQ